MASITQNAPGATFFERIALPLIERGLKIAPCYPKSKEVHGKLVPRPLEMLSADPAQIRRWAEQEPNANICVYAQQIEGGLCFLDNDKGDVPQAYRQETGREFPKTFFVRSSVREGVERGHWYFLQTARTRAFAKNITERETAGWFSFRVKNFYVVSAGSIHPDTGMPYSVRDDIPIIPMPEALLDWLQTKMKPPEPETREETAARGKIPKGQRYPALMTEIGRLWQRGTYSRELVIKMGVAWAKENFDLNGARVFNEAKVRKEITNLIRAYAPGAPRVDRPQVIVRDGETPVAIDEAETVLAPSAADLGIFQRTELVKVIALPEPLVSRGLKRPAGAVMLTPMTNDALMETFESLIKFVRMVDARKGPKPIPINCPSRLSRFYISRRKYRLPQLTGIIEAPCLRPDGTVLTESGYDPGTGLYLATAEQWSIPDRPSPTDAGVALRQLLRPFGQFPFVDAAGEPPPYKENDWDAVEQLLDRPSAAVFVCGILTALQRRLLESAPIFGFSAPQPRYGKSMLARAIAIIATGREAPASSLGKDEDEVRKMILSALREGHLITHLDNVARPVESPDLCKCITEPMYSDRVLGESRVLAFPTNMMWTVTGNNLAFRGDLSARALRCRIDAKKQKPEEREFKTKDLPTELRALRTQLVTAALTILRAYFLAGRLPQSLPNWGGFNQWSDDIRSAVVWAGMADPCNTRAQVAEDDTETEEAAALLYAFDKVFGTAQFTAKEARTEADTRKDVREALLAVAGNKGEIQAPLLGWWMRRWKDRVVSVEDVDSGETRIRLMRLTQKGKTGGNLRWGIETLDTL